MCKILAVPPKGVLPFLGRFEETLLVSLIRLNKPSSAREIRMDIEACSDSPIAVTVLYATLGRLESKGLIHSREEGPTGKPGGRSKHVFEITSAGRKAASEAREFTKRVWKDVVNPQGVAI